MNNGQIWPAPESACCAMRPEAGRGRRFPEPEAAYRGLWQRDRDRIVHCAAFRRLEGKTQVFVTSVEGDHFRNRLTHTLEVAQIARTAARALGLNEDLVEAMALCHDIGHGPFGHAGEDALTEALAAANGIPETRLREATVRRRLFDHNVQGLRMVDELERTHARFIGLNLTYETREGFAKNHVRAGGVGRPRAELGFAADESPTLEVQLVGCADEIAYDSHDVDDGLAGGVLREEDLCVRRLCRDARAQVLAAHPELCRETSLRHRALVRRLIRMSVDDLLNETIRRLREKRVAALADVRACPEELVGFSKEFSFAKEELEKYLRGHFYSHPDVEANRRLWRSRLKQLFSAYLSDPRLLPSPYCARIVGAGKRDASGESPLRVVCDYVGGMTDRYAENRWREICGEPA